MVIYRAGTRAWGTDRESGLRMSFAQGWLLGVWRSRQAAVGSSVSAQSSHENLGVSHDAYHRYRRPCSQHVSFVMVN